MDNKTQKAIRFFNNCEYVNAFKIVMRFQKTIGKENAKIFSLAYESNTHIDFYKSLGYDKDVLLMNAVGVFSDIYLKKCQK